MLQEQRKTIVVTRIKDGTVEFMTSTEHWTEDLSEANALDVMVFHDDNDNTNDIWLSDYALLGWEIGYSYSLLEVVKEVSITLSLAE